MRITKSTRTVACTAMLALGLAACGNQAVTGASQGDPPVRMELREPQNLLYPGDSVETEGSEVMAAVFAPLVSYTNDGRVIDNVAESIKSSDSKVWTIKIKPGYTWHNGEPLIAQNYVDSWNYNANRDNAQGANGSFQRVEGWDDLNPPAGQPLKTKKMRGLKVLDERTFQVTLTKPFSQFRLMLGYGVYFPIPKVALGPDGKITPEYVRKPIGQGFFKFDKPYIKGVDQVIELSRYDAFPGQKPKFDKLQFKIYTDSEAAFNDLRAGDLDIHDSLSPAAITSAKAEFGERYIDQVDAGVGYIGFPLQFNKTYENVKIREAISMAIDRRTISEVVFSGTRAPADDFINPLIDGYRPNACGVCSYNPAKARALYAESNGPKLLELGYNSDDAHKEWVEAVANNLRANLGVKVRVRSFEKFATMFNNLADRKYGGMFRAGWAMDYPSPENYLAPSFATVAIKTGSNFSGWSNKEFDSLLAKGDSARSQRESLKYYQRADDVLIKELPYIPVYFYRTNAAFSQNIRGLKINMLNQIEWTKIDKTR